MYSIWTLFFNYCCLSVYSRNIPLWGLETIWRNGEAVGFLRRADYGFTLKKSIGYGYVQRAGNEPLTADYLRNGDYSIESMGVKYKAHIHMKTPFDPQNNRVRGIY